ncbi:MAG: protein-disulfide reductase DsbD [Sulfurospirillum sp.]|nr:protein-disulfide reductase DsbD [Sulfurospirillum sp.]
MIRLLKFFLIGVFFAIPIFSDVQKKVLLPEEAFKVTVKQKGDFVTVNLELGENIYLYEDKLKFNIIEPIEESIDHHIDRPLPVDYEGYQVYKNSLEFLIPVSAIKKHVSSEKFKLEIKYQGCSTSGICYQPIKSEFSFDLGKMTNKIENHDEEHHLEHNLEHLSEQDFIASTLQNGNILVVLLSFLGFGILLSLTPCIFPMIPILSSIIVSQSGEKLSTKRAFMLSFVYVIAMASAYTIAGVLAGLFGANISSSLQNPWIIGVFSAIFVGLAFSMFGFYELQIPSFIQSKLSKKSNNMKGQGVVGVAIMGFLSALIMGPCIAAPLAGALIYIGQSGDALLGGVALFVMGIGMGIPLVIIGAGAGKYMPKPGRWMDAIKFFFGVVMLGLAIWTLARVVPANIIMFLWALLFIGSSIYMGALESLKEGVSGWSKLIKSFSIIVFIYGVMLFIGSVSNATNPLNPLESFLSKSIMSSSHKIEETNNFQTVATLKELNAIIEESHKPVIVDIYADWCVSCVEFEENTFLDLSVKKKLEEFKLVKIDVTKNSNNDKELLKEFGIFGPPTIMFFKNKKEIKNRRVVGHKNAKEFLTHLNSF